MLYQTMNLHGGDIYSDHVELDFSANLNPLSIPHSVLESMKETLSDSSHYPDPYCRDAIRAISEHEKLPDRYIMMGNGAAELIYSFCLSVSPQKALIPVPSFSEYENALKLNNCKVTSYLLQPSNEFLLDSNFLEAIAEEKPDVIFLCNPNNPTGRAIDADLLHKIIQLTGILGIGLFLDECFIDLSENCTEMKKFIPDHKNLFILKALTKSYALAGIRAGYCLSSDQKLLERMSKTVQPWNVSTIAQSAVIAALKEKSYIIEARKIIHRERRWLNEKLNSLGCHTYPSEANFILFQAPYGLDVYLKSVGISIRNCSNFDGLDHSWYRIAIRLHSENEILIRNIRNFMEDTAK